jgi:hypothetical protein
LDRGQNHGTERWPGRDDLATARRLEAANGAKSDIVGDFPVKFVGHWTSLLPGYTGRIRRNGAERPTVAASAGNVAFFVARLE